MLVYYSFQQQLKANDIQIKANAQTRLDVAAQLAIANKNLNFDLIEKLLTKLNDRLNEENRV